ncbi:MULTISPECIES: Fe-S biogenesis protein NfuA [Halomonadaceae]|jgi:Fe/S biogenesis protein NfuA|uniref:Fe/S biogenesis protein NfuA n=1 Tax=Vreelandella sedimenti TaxID=2729618 RepID=A0A7Z0N934_9GAMM|nr:MULTISPECIES: Fe-S biogenesis protein NfuA [Halomonas]NAO97162.1 Fe-S biogenesis protein NfuA [Halomonas sp. MG34]QGQ70559.1 Fe-S biogenesis protein NfuA [Halomonas sp. PA16-9]UEQ06444.1 Fe-S biogenesis protein NfuA [Halomonas profundus]MCE7517224.1 Fe-S biogenesis protein NfuA [Halomonas titanicae]NYT73429.1 Fe-S biogenesis protein NfuA [Halomonas sedimenti]|tara:strand:+ start:45905 stop:46528 length:624 start_codon:yes stop_codon:yes gene_type:complete
MTTTSEKETSVDTQGIDITNSAQEYLAELLEKQNVEGIAVRIFITQPGTPYAETCLAYCRPGEEEPTDVLLELEKINVFLDKNSLAFLEEAVVDFNADRMGGQLTIKAPNAKMPKVNADSPLEDRINYVLYSEINPGLAAHGGEIKLVELTEQQYAVLAFGGGCQGCAAVDLTLKDGVEKTLMERIPELAGIRDVTDHSDTTNAYYR